VDGHAIVEDAGNKIISSEDALKLPAFREQLLLGKKVCDAYVAKTKKEAPAGCGALPQTDADLGTDPFAKFKQTDFTSLIAKIKVEDAQQLKELKEAAEESQTPWQYRAVLIAGAVPLVGVSAFYTWQYLQHAKNEQVTYSSLNV